MVSPKPPVAQQLGKDFNCVTANKTDETLKFMSEQGPFHVIVCDYPIPGMNTCGIVGNRA